MSAKQSYDEKLIRKLRAKLKQKEFYLIENKRKTNSDSDRRLAFFSYVEDDRRIYNRRNEIYESIYR